MHWQTTRQLIDLAVPRVMGIVNVTPDSFSDGGRHATAAAALRHCESLVAEGADILDIGGESSRPGSPPVPLGEELERVLPVLRGALQLGVPVSIDTCKPEAMRAALDLGCDIVNDIRGFRQSASGGCPDAAEVVASHPSCGVCIMHMHGEPRTMQKQPMQGDAVPQVREFLVAAAQDLQARGMARARIVLDPGIGFGKTVAQNFALLQRQAELCAAGYPILAGWSRKSSLGTVTGLPVEERLVPSVAAALLSVERGARIVRVHDVRETVAALKVWNAMQETTARAPQAGTT